MQGLSKKIAAWFARQWLKLRPGPESRRGATYGLCASAAVAVIIAGLNIQTGFGLLFDFAFATVAAALIILITALIVALILTIARHLPRMATGVMIGCAVVVMLIWGPPQLGASMAVVIGLAEGFLGAAIATFYSGEFRHAAFSKRFATTFLFSLSLLVNVGLIWLLAHEGSMENLVAWKPPAQSMPAKLQAPDPSANGPYRVKTLTYGSGTDIRRPEYKAVAIKSRTVDAAAFFKDFKGWKRWSRRKYWGFDMDKLPLNGRVWYPDGPGPFPLVLIVHGNHQMTEFSDPGYAYLGELLASRGFILVSIDENFLNSGLFHDPPKQQQVRGWMLLEHLKLWREWNGAADNPFRNKVDMERIALMGHSRGGEAAATAAAFNHMKYYPEDADIRFDYNFAIKSIVAIAPPDGQYKPAGEFRRIRDVSYLVLQGAHDGDVASFLGSRQWDHVLFTQPGPPLEGPRFKAEIYAYRANHGQFNTVWGRDDSGGPPFGWLMNLKPLLPPEEQRRISKTYIAAFLEATLRGRQEYVPLFHDWRTGRAWLPDTLYINRYRDASYIPLAAFDEDADLTTTTAPGGHIDGEHLSIWHEGRIPSREGDRGYNAVSLGWNRTPKAPVPTYTLTLPEGAAERWRLNASSTLELSIAAVDEDAPEPGKNKDDDKKKNDRKKERESPDFTVEFVTTDGMTVSSRMSRFAAVPPPLTVTFTKVSLIDSIGYKKSSEPVFQTVRIPLSIVSDPANLATVRLKFDVTPMSVILLSSVGFGSP